MGLIQESRILLADKPVASLDPDTARIVLEQLRMLAKSRGLAVLCTLNQPHLAAEFADRTLHMRSGRIVAAYSPPDAAHDLPDQIANLHNFPRHAMSSSDYRALRSEAMVAWREIAELGVAAELQGKAPRLRMAAGRQVDSTSASHLRRRGSAETGSGRFSQLG